MLLAVSGSALLLSFSLTCALPAIAADPASSSSSAAESDQLSDIVVVARRREESAQSVPIAITAISADKLEQQGVTTDEDILKAVPSVGVHSPFRDSTYIAIRGQDSKGAVVTYLDEVPILSTGVNDPDGIGVGGPAMIRSGPGHRDHYRDRDLGISTCFPRRSMPVSAGSR
jgi:outer membrane receptor protein involved in Fe transport